VLGDSRLTDALLADAGTPMVRLVQFPAYIYVPILLGVACLIMCTLLMMIALARLAFRCHTAQRLEDSSGAGAP
jgi:hypothetical protein